MGAVGRIVSTSTGEELTSTDTTRLLKKYCSAKLQPLAPLNLR